MKIYTRHHIVQERVILHVFELHCSRGIPLSSEHLFSFDFSRRDAAMVASTIRELQFYGDRTDVLTWLDMLGQDCPPVPICAS